MRQSRRSPARKNGATCAPLRPGTAYSPLGTLDAARLDLNLGLGLWRLREAGFIKSTPQKIIAEGTDWRFLNELKRELKA